MDYTDRYIHRLNYKGSNPNEARSNTSKRITNAQFTTSPSFYVVKLNGIDTDSIVNEDAKYDEKQIFFRPDSLVDIGSVVDYKGKKYLLMSFVDNEIYPKGDLKFCNSLFPLQSETTKILIGNDPNTGRPIYDEVFTYSNEPCVAESQYSKSSEVNQFVIPEGRIVITMKYQTSESLALDYEFSMYGNKYRISDFDYTSVIDNKGIMKIIAEKVV